MKSTFCLRVLIPAALAAALSPVSDAGAMEPKGSRPVDDGFSFGQGAAVIPPAPASVSAKGLNASVQLSWTPADNATSYNVYQGTSAVAESSLAVQSGITATTATIAGLKNDNGYFFRISASGAAGESAKSVEVRAIPYLPITDAPVLSVGSGSYSSVQHVSISDTVAGASIFYTVDGSLPTTASSPYAGPLTVDSTTVLRAIAVAPDHSASGISSAVYTLSVPPAVEVPVFSVLAGTYTSTQYVTISDGTKGASIFYTTDGSDPTASSTAFTSSSLPIQVKTTTTLKAIATATGYSDSPIASVTYTINPPPSSGGGAMELDALLGLGALALLRRRRLAR